MGLPWRPVALTVQTEFRESLTHAAQPVQIREEDEGPALGVAASLSPVESQGCVWGLSPACDS